MYLILDASDITLWPPVDGSRQALDCHGGLKHLVPNFHLIRHTVAIEQL